MEAERFFVPAHPVVERLLQEVQKGGHLLTPGKFGLGHRSNAPVSWQQRALGW